MEHEFYEERREDPSLKLFVVLSKATRTILDLAQDDMVRYGLNPTEFATLELLYHRGETASTENRGTYIVNKWFDYLRRKQLREKGLSSTYPI
nr:hypothetical protein [Piscibacillus salipiscarius]